MGFFKTKFINKRVAERSHPYRMGRSFLDWLKLTAGFVFAVLFLCCLYQFFVVSATFNLKEVEMTGELDPIRRETLLKLAHIPYSENLFTVSLGRISQNVSRHPWVRHVQVRRKFPRALSIHITEQQPFAIVVAGDFYYMNQEGQLFKKMSPGEDRQFPLITGFNQEGLRKYPGYFGPKVKGVSEFLKGFLQHPASKSLSVREVHTHITGGIWVSVTRPDQSSPMVLYFGNSPFQEGLSRWGRLVEAMGDGPWFKSVDLQVKDKIFARN